MRVDVKPALLRWARERSGRGMDFLVRRFPKYPHWERGEIQPTFKQLQRFADVTYTPLGMFFLSQPLEDSLSIPDFRTDGSSGVSRPSLNLLQTLELYGRRQDWYRHYVRTKGEGPLPFVGSATLKSDVRATAARMRKALNFDLTEREKLRTSGDAMRHLVEEADELGVLVMVSGIVGNNTSRQLDPGEFCGFALADEYAPLVFINGADAQSAQMFTLAHELAHIWLGESALSDSGPHSVFPRATTPAQVTEAWCNQVAAELLVPLEAVRDEFRPDRDPSREAARLARVFKVNTLVILRRLHDAGHAPRQRLEQACELQRREWGQKTRRYGGSFYPPQFARIGKRLARALVADTLEGRTLYRDAFQLLGVRKQAAFDKLASELGYG